MAAKCKNCQIAEWSFNHNRSSSPRGSFLAQLLAVLAHLLHLRVHLISKPHHCFVYLCFLWAKQLRGGLEKRNTDTCQKWQRLQQIWWQGCIPGGISCFDFSV